MRGALFGDELSLPNFSPTWVPASTPNHKNYLCTRKVAAWLRENFIRLIAEGGGTVSRSSRPRSWVGLQASAPDHPTKVLSRLYGGRINHARDERLLASRAPASQVVDGPLRAIPASPADPSVHGPEAAAAVPAACRYRCCRPGAGNRHRLGPERAAAMVSRRRLRVRLLEGSAERLPCIIADGSVDTVVVTWALCSVPDAT